MAAFSKPRNTQRSLPVLFGPHNFSFRETVADLLAADAGILVQDRAALTDALAGLVASPSARAEMGQRARRVVLDGQGAADRNLLLIMNVLGQSASCSPRAQQAQCRQSTNTEALNE